MNNTLQNGFMVLEYLASDGEECSVKDLAEHFNLPNSHVCRLLKTLTETGYVEQTPGNRKYRISLKILNLSNVRLQKLKFRTIARPYLQQLTQTLNRPVFLTANFRGYSLIIDTEYPNRFTGDAGLAIGQFHSVNRSACGKICAAYASEADLERIMTTCDWTHLTERSVTEPAVFKNELKQIRKQGYSQMIEETRIDLGAVGAPIFQADRALTGAVGVILPALHENWNEESLEFFIGQTKSCGESISFALGYPLEK